MQFICESSHKDDYLAELPDINYTHPLIQQKVQQFLSTTTTPLEYARAAFEFVRDEITHSIDAQDSRVTCRASDVLEVGTGLCYAKAHLLAALLRARNIPTGLCYQRLTDGDPDVGFLHGLNAVYIEAIDKWVRLDARGNKPGIQAEFNLEEEQLAFAVQSELGEIDYPSIYTQPNPKVLKALREHTDCLYLCKYELPGAI